MKIQHITTDSTVHGHTVKPNISKSHFLIEISNLIGLANWPNLIGQAIWPNLIGLANWPNLIGLANWST